MKKLTVLFTALLLTLTMAFAVFAGTGHVFDKAGLFTADEAADLERQIEQLKASTGFDAISTTADSLEGESTRDYSDIAYEQAYVDKLVGADGIGFLIDMENGEFYISTQGEAQRYLTDQRVDSLLDSAFNAYDRNGESFYSAAAAVITGTAQYHAAGIEEGQFTVEEEQPQPKTLADRIKSLIIALIPSLGVSAATAKIYTGNIKRQYKMQNINEAANTIASLGMAAGAYKFAASTDDLINKTVSQRIIPVPAANNNRGSGRPGQTTIHMGPSHGPMGGSMSHGGGGRSFRK